MPPVEATLLLRLDLFQLWAMSGEIFSERGGHHRYMTGINLAMMAVPTKPPSTKRTRAIRTPHINIIGLRSSIRMRSCTARHPWDCHRPTPVGHILSDLGPSSIARSKVGPQLRGRPGRQLRGRANRGCGGMRQEPEKRKTWLVPRGARPE